MVCMVVLNWCWVLIICIVVLSVVEFFILIWLMLMFVLIGVVVLFGFGLYIDELRWMMGFCRVIWVR